MLASLTSRCFTKCVDKPGKRWSRRPCFCGLASPTVHRGCSKEGLLMRSSCCFFFLSCCRAVSVEQPAAMSLAVRSALE